MFSPGSAIKETQASSLRVSRRRQREDSDNIRHQPLRKRSKLSENTFVPHRHASPYSPTSSTSTTTSAADPYVNGISTVKRNGSADWTLGSCSASRLKDIPVHEKKQQQQQQQQQHHHHQYQQQHPPGFAPKRVLKADGSTILVSGVLDCLSMFLIIVLTIETDKMFAIHGKATASIARISAA